jgi:hypothetical protein
MKPNGNDVDVSKFSGKSFPATFTEKSGADGRSINNN